MIRTDMVLIKPIVTEKTVAMKGKHVFSVHPDATKSDVKKALKDFYGLDIKKVNIIRIPEKTKIVKRGQVARKRAPLKKAVVTLVSDKTLDFNAFK